MESDELRVLDAIPHGNKLRTGHLRGNRFVIIVRDVVADAQTLTTPISVAIRASGFPNYYGEQRFGIDGQTLTLGLDLLSGRKSPRDIPFSQRKFLLRLALSSVQSDLFNKALARRLKDGLLQTVLDGDVMEVAESGGKFVVDDVSRDQLRLNAGELSVTGPMFGVKMLMPCGKAAELESELLNESGLLRSEFANYANLLSGARRAYLVRPSELATSMVEGGIQFQFALPTGVYATILLREFMKPQDTSDNDFSS